MSRIWYCLLAIAAGSAHAQSELDELVAAEHAFAQSVADVGVRDGFLRHLAEEAIVFRPLPTPARGWFAAQDTPDFTLAWRPWFAEIAGSGDFGYTIGPWVSSSLVEGARPDGHGFYATVWLRNGDGEWRALADHGVSVGEAAAPREGIARLGVEPTQGTAGTYVMNRRYQSLLEAALRLPAAQAGGEAAAIERSWLADDLLVLRAARTPLQGHEAVRQIISGELGASAPGMTVMAASADLGMSLGGEPGSGAYLRLWRHHADRGWQLAVEVATPVVAAAGAASTPDGTGPGPGTTEEDVAEPSPGDD